MIHSVHYTVRMHVPSLAAIRCSIAQFSMWLDQPIPKLRARFTCGHLLTWVSDTQPMSVWPEYHVKWWKHSMLWISFMDSGSLMYSILPRNYLRLDQTPHHQNCCTCYIQVCFHVGAFYLLSCLRKWFAIFQQPLHSWRYWEPIVREVWFAHGKD